MKHRNSEMIIAKSENTELVVFIKYVDGWAISGFEDLICLDNPFFLCIPKHKGAVLCGLNGGEFQVKGSGHSDYSGNWYLDSKDWRARDVWYMMDNHHSRVKPRKEKRWIGYCANTNQTFQHPQSSREVAEDFAARSYGYTLDKWQFIEIEVEV